MPTLRNPKQLLSALEHTLEQMQKTHRADAEMIRWLGNGVLWLSTCPTYKRAADEIARQNAEYSASLAEIRAREAQEQRQREAAEQAEAKARAKEQQKLRAARMAEVARKYRWNHGALEVNSTGGRDEWGAVLRDSAIKPDWRELIGALPGCPYATLADWPEYTPN